MTQASKANGAFIRASKTAKLFHTPGTDKIYKGASLHIDIERSH